MIYRSHRQTLCVVEKKRRGLGSNAMGYSILNVKWGLPQIARECHLAGVAAEGLWFGASAAS
jgi:hypothetical protein